MKHVVFFAMSMIIIVAFPLLCNAQSKEYSETKNLLSAFVSYSELRIQGVQQNLEILASISELKSGKWENMKDILAEYQKNDSSLIIWFVLPDGSYYTVSKGLMDVKLNDRAYFPRLFAGEKVIGDLVVSKSTGKRSAVFAVPVVSDGKIIGGIGASLFLDVLSQQVGSVFELPKDMGFFALSPEGLTVLHSHTERTFLDPRELGSETLKKAIDEMLSQSSGQVAYYYDNMNKQAVFSTSQLTHWRFAITFEAK